MASKYKINSKGVIKGSSKKDNISWISTWKRGLTVYGKAGKDTLNFKKSKYKNKLYGEKGNDTIYGGKNKDTINGGTGKDKLYGYDGNDKIAGESGNDSLYGGNGNDKLDGGSGYDYLNGGEGNDYISGGSGIDTLYGGNGNDTIYCGSSNDIADGNNGNDIIYANSGNNTLKGGYGNDTINTGTGNDTIYGGFGTDTINLNKGFYTIKFSNVSGTDKLYNIENSKGVNLDIAQNTQIVTERVNRDLILYLSNKSFKYMQNVRLMNYYNSDDTINIDVAQKIHLANMQDFNPDEYMASTSLGVNECNYNYSGTENQFIKSNNLDSAITTDSGDDIIYSGNGNNKITSGNGNDIIYLNKGNDTINSGQGNDIIGKGSGNCAINTQDGNDIIYVGTGKSTINTGLGNNRIVFDNDSGNTILADGKGTDTLEFSANTKLTYKFDNNNLVITQGTYKNTITIKNYETSTSVKNIKTGTTAFSIESIMTRLTRGSNAAKLTLLKGKDLILILKNPFSGKNYTYSLTAKSGKQAATFQYLKNGRLVVKGNYISVTASSGQSDDLLLLGNNNVVNTGDGNDCIRVGTALDSCSITNTKSSSYNIINSGSGNDHITLYGLKNKVDAGTGSKDTVLKFSNSNGTIKNSETTLTDSQNTKTLNGKIDWFRQGTEGGDCRLLALIDSLSRSKNFNLSDYIKIRQYFDKYQVSFTKNRFFTEDFCSVTTAELADCNNVHGDLDMVVIDCALNKLFEKSKTTVERASYNQISKAIFGTSATTYEYINTKTKSKFEQLWNAYKSGKINNLTVGIFSQNDYSQGIISGHAYSVHDYNSNAISLINVWDNADTLKLDTSTFYNLSTVAMVYGYDFYNKNETYKQGGYYASQSESEYAASAYSTSDIAQLAAETASWTTNTNMTTDVVYEDNIYNQQINCCFVNDSSSTLGLC